MAPKLSLFERMKANARGDWTIAEIRTLCEAEGLECAPPTRGSHFKVSSDLISGILTIPHKRPIKAIYVRKLIGLVEAHRIASSSRKGD